MGQDKRSPGTDSSLSSLRFLHPTLMDAESSTSSTFYRCVPFDYCKIIYALIVRVFFSGKLCFTEQCPRRNIVDFSLEFLIDIVLIET